MQRFSSKGFYPMLMLHTHKILSGASGILLPLGQGKPEHKKQHCPRSSSYKLAVQHARRCRLQSTQQHRSRSGPGAEPPLTSTEAACPQESACQSPRRRGLGEDRGVVVVSRVMRLRSPIHLAAAIHLHHHHRQQQQHTAANRP